MKEKLCGKGLFVYSDPGGAKPILALVKSLYKESEEYIIISDREYGFVKDFSLKVRKPGLASTDIEAFNPDFIFTGTSYTSKIELAYIREGRERGILTYAFVDHWTNIRERFSNNGEEILPNKICLIDERAKEIGLQQGIPASSILVIGNPFQDFLRSWQPTISKDEFIRSLGITVRNKKILVFAPDPLSNVDGINKFGFDEVLVINQLENLIDQLLQHYIFILKPHPNQEMSRLNNEVLSKIKVVGQDVDNNSLIFYSDIVMGFFSSYLIEAQIMRKRVLRYIPELAINDPFKDNNIGIVVNEKNLLEYL